MLQLKRVVFFLLIIMFAGSYGSIAQDPAEWEAILAGADIGDGLISSGQGNILFEYVRTDSSSTRAQELDQEHRENVSPDVMVVVRNQENVELNFAFSGKRFRCDESSINKLPEGRWYSQDWQWAYNGEKLDLLILDGIGENGLIIPRGSIRAENVPRINRFDPRINGLKIMGTPVGSFLRGSFENNTVIDLSVIGEEAQDNILCKVIQGYVVTTGDSIKVWLAPNMMYRPKHVELISWNEITVVHNTFKEYTGGIWYPETLQKEQYYIDEQTGGNVLYYRETITVLNDFVINTVVPSNLFEVTFPSGLMVFDYRIGEKVEIE